MNSESEREGEREGDMGDMISYNFLFFLPTRGLYITLYRIHVTSCHHVTLKGVLFLCILFNNFSRICLIITMFHNKEASYSTMNSNRNEMVT